MLYFIAKTLLVKDILAIRNSVENVLISKAENEIHTSRPSLLKACFALLYWRISLKHSWLVRTSLTTQCPFKSGASNELSVILHCTCEIFVASVKYWYLLMTNIVFFLAALFYGGGVTILFIFLFFNFVSWIFLHSRI